MAPARVIGPGGHFYLCYHAAASLYVAQSLQFTRPSSLELHQPIKSNTLQTEVLSASIVSSDDRHFRNTTEWSYVRSTNTSDADASVASDGICFGKYSVPQVYLLGAQLAGSSTLADDLLTAGLHSGHEDGITKELHRFDGHCGWRLETGRTDQDWAGESCSGTCRNFTENDKDIFALSFNHLCSSIQYADMTPLNLRLPGLSTVLADLYGAYKHRLKFIIGLRDPVQRLHSGYYHEKDFNNYATFTEYVDMLLATVPDYEDNRKMRCTMSSNYLIDQFYRSMYSLNIEPWLDEFAPHQFAIIPMSLYFRQASIRQDLLDAVAQHLSISSIHSKSIKIASAVHAHPDYPKLDNDLAADRIEWLRKHYFGPDTKRLARTLAPVVGNGLMIAGYSGPAKSAPIFNYLWDNW